MEKHFIKTNLPSITIIFKNKLKVLFLWMFIDKFDSIEKTLNDGMIVRAFGTDGGKLRAEIISLSEDRRYLRRGGIKHQSSLNRCGTKPIF